MVDVSDMMASPAERVSVKRKDDTMSVTLPVGDYDENKIRSMILERGMDPDAWTVRSVIVNEWDMAGQPQRQTKAFLDRVVPAAETAWGQLAAALKDRVRTPRPPSKKLKDGAGPTTIVLMGDDQAPHVNWPLHEAACEMLADLKPDRFVYMGDGCDFDSVSHFDVAHPEWASTLNEGLSVCYRVLAERLEAAGWPPGDYIPGNHENRLRKFLLNKAPALFGVKAGNMPADAPSVLSLPFLLSLDELGLTYATSPLGDYPHPRVDLAPGFVASHGWVVRKGAGASALASIDRLNASLAIGHTHRLAVAHHTRWDANRDPEIYTVVETGTMADPRGLGYAVDPDWQSGFAVVTVWADGHYTADVATWRDRTLTFRDRRWTLTATGVRRS
jgi:hypothetical protein